MKRNFILILFLLSSITCFSQRNDPYFTTSRILKYNCGGFDNDTVGYFKGQLLLDSSSKLLQPNKGTVSIKSVNEATYKLSVYSINNDSGNFNIRLTRGYYALSITEQGYQPLIINGFYSSPNHGLYIKAVLEPGNIKATYTIDSNCLIKKDVPSKPSRVATFYYGDPSDTTIAMLWGQIFLNTISPSGDSAIGLGKASIKYRCIETHDSGFAQTDDASRFSIYFKDGHYDLTISSPGYQPVVIKNYAAYEARISYLDAVLQPGDDKSVFSITNDGKVEKEQ